MANDKLTIHRKAYDRKAYTRSDGTRVKATHIPSSTFKIKDQGKKGRTKPVKNYCLSFHYKGHTYKRTVAATSIKEAEGILRHNQRKQGKTIRKVRRW